MGAALTAQSYLSGEERDDSWRTCSPTAAFQRKNIVMRSFLVSSVGVASTSTVEMCQPRAVINGGIMIEILWPTDPTDVVPGQGVAGTAFGPGRQ